MSEGFRQRLREETTPSHEALERDLAWEDRIATREGYRSLLARFLGFHAVIEPAIGHALGDEAFLSPRRRLGLLEADLRHLGLSQHDIEAAPRPPPIVLDGPAEALGALYVLEGSTLGGKVIGRRVSTLHGFDAQGGCAYYGGHGDQAGAMWRAFCARLDTVSDEAEQARVVASADATFEAMRLWLCAEDAVSPAA